MKRKKRYLARLDEVAITRHGESVEIRYLEEGVPTTSLTIGPSLALMSDAQVLALFNETLTAQSNLAASYEHQAVEVALGSPQIEATPSGQLVPRGDVLRCAVHDDEHGELVVGIDGHELTLGEFGRMLTTYAGWA